MKSKSITAQFTKANLSSCSGKHHLGQRTLVEFRQVLLVYEGALRHHPVGQE